MHLLKCFLTYEKLGGSFDYKYHVSFFMLCFMP